MPRPRRRWTWTWTWTATRSLAPALTAAALLLSSCAKPAAPPVATPVKVQAPAPPSRPPALTAHPAPAPAPAPKPAVAPKPAPSKPPTAATAPAAKPGGDLLEAMDRRIGEGIARALESAVALEYTAADSASGRRRVASGVVVSPEGDVLSVGIDAPAASTPVVAVVASGRRLSAQWVAADPETGLTLLKIAPRAARPAIVAARKPHLGLSVLVIGNPFNLAHSVSRGFVAGLNRRLELGPRQLGGLIQIDASLHPGDSGALLADLQGGWLGVIRSGLASPSEGDRKGRDRELDHDLGFAIPARHALWIAGQLRAFKRVDRAYLGVTMDASPPPPAPPGEPEGAVLGRVLADTPGERAGLKAGDRVVAIDGHAVRSPYDLTDRLDRIAANSEIKLDLVRGTGPTRHSLRLTLRAARRPPFEPSRPSPPGKSRSSESRTAIPPEIAETIRKLERRIEELEKEKDKEKRTAVVDEAEKPKSEDSTAQAHTP